MAHKITLIIVLSLITISCSQIFGQTKSEKSAAFTPVLYQPNTPQEMDDYVVKLFTGLRPHAVSWGLALKEKKYSKQKQNRIAIISYIDSSIIKLDNIADVGGSEKYRGAAIFCLDSMRNYLDRAYKPFDMVKTSITPKELKVLTDNLFKLTSKEEEAVSKIVDIPREEYCRLNHLNCAL